MSNDLPALYLRELCGSSFEDGRLKNCCSRYHPD